ncbi:hypothetical protein HK101_010288 [Irineochytrium annulatum]|nr:hypothetical protein HK101_010288 [Irineochytrium annulatum]
MRGFGAHIEQDSRADKTRYGQEIRAGGVRWERGQQPAPRGGGRDGEQLQEGRVGGVCSRDERQHEPLYASRRLSQERQVGPSNTRRDYEEHQARGREDVRREHQSDPRRVESYRQRPEQEPLSRSQPHKVDQQLEIRADGTGMEPQQQEIRPGDDWKESDPQPEAARTTAGKAREKKLNKRLFELRQRAFPGPGPSTSAAAVAPSEALASRPSNSSFRHNSIMPPSEDHATRPSEASKKNKIVVPAINDPASRKLGSPPKARISITRKASKDGDAPVQFLERSASSVTTTGTSQESGERNERRTRIAPGISQSTQEDDREASEQNEGHHASGFGRRRSDAEAKIKGRRKNSVRGVNPAAMAFVPSRPQTPDAVRALRAEIAEDEERRAQEDRKIAEKKKRLAEIVERQNSWVGDRQKGI